MKCGERFGTDNLDLNTLLTDNTTIYNASDIFILNDDLQEYLDFIDQIRLLMKDVVINREIVLKTLEPQLNQSSIVMSEKFILI
jgi:type IV secretory pathway TrbF-like protein